MLDLARLRRVKLHRRPLGQLVVGNLGLALDYRFPKRTEIVIEGAGNVPAGGGAFLAMNHTDRYNYWPFQYQMYRMGLPFTATWVKGKYYENNWVGAFMDSTNNIPMPSRGYVITTEFRKATGRPPSEQEYRVLRDLVDGRRGVEDPLPSDAGAELAEFLSPGGNAKSAKEFLHGFDQLFDSMIREVVELNRSAIEDLELNVLVFPEGTRSPRLSRGHNGLAQIAQYLGAPILPVGCNGSDKLYPGNSPLSKGGRVVYRIGAPLRVDGPELAAFRVPRDVLPFTTEATRRHDAEYTAITQLVMSRIEELLDPEYKSAAEAPDTKARGAERFV